MSIPGHVIHASRWERRWLVVSFLRRPDMWWSDAGAGESFIASRLRAVLSHSRQEQVSRPRPHRGPRRERERALTPLGGPCLIRYTTTTHVADGRGALARGIVSAHISGANRLTLGRCALAASPTTTSTGIAGAWTPPSIGESDPSAASSDPAFPAAWGPTTPATAGWLAPASPCPDPQPTAPCYTTTRAADPNPGGDDSLPRRLGLLTPATFPGGTPPRCGGRDSPAPAVSPRSASRASRPPAVSPPCRGE